MATYNDIKKIKIGDNIFNLYDSGNTNTWRAIQVNGTQVLAGTTGTNALNLKAGTGISLSNSSGTVTITNSSINTDTKLQVSEITSGTVYSLIMGSQTTANTRQYDSTGLTYVGHKGTTSSQGSSQLMLGNSAPVGTAGNQTGIFTIYGKNDWTTSIYASEDAVASGELGVNIIRLPKEAGTLALNTPASASANGLMTKEHYSYIESARGALNFSSTLTYLKTDSSTTDTNLISAITSLGWDSDVIS